MEKSPEATGQSRQEGEAFRQPPKHNRRSPKRCAARARNPQTHVCHSRRSWKTLVRLVLVSLAPILIVVSSQSGGKGKQLASKRDMAGVAKYVGGILPAPKGLNSKPWGPEGAKPESPGQRPGNAENPATIALKGRNRRFARKPGSPGRCPGLSGFAPSGQSQRHQSTLLHLGAVASPPENPASLRVGAHDMVC